MNTIHGYICITMNQISQNWEAFLVVRQISLRFEELLNVLSAMEETFSWKVYIKIFTIMKFFAKVVTNLVFPLYIL